MKKMNIILYVVTILAILWACMEQKNNQTINNDKSFEITIESDTWKKVVGKEWSNYDAWAGSGLYFNEEDGKAYCTFMIYGSGVRVAGHNRSIAKVDEKGNILISLPRYVSTGDLSFTDSESDEEVEVKLSVGNDSIIFGNHEFKYQQGINNYKYIKW